MQKPISNPTTINSLEGLCVLLGAEPQKDHVLDIRHFGYKPPKHPLGLPDLAEGKPLCAVVDFPEEFDGTISESYRYRGIGELKGRVKIMLAQRETPAMRITVINGREKMYELTYPSAEYTYITPPVEGEELQKDFSDLFEFLSEIYRVECISEARSVTKRTE